MFMCEICGKAKVMYMAFGVFFWKCPDENCKSNKHVITCSDRSGV